MFILQIKKSNFLKIKLTKNIDGEIYSLFVILKNENDFLKAKVD